MQQQIDPSIYDDLLSSGSQSAGLDPQIAMQQAMAQRMRAAGVMPREAYSSGRRAVAPSKFEYLNAMMNQGLAGQADQQGMALQAQQQTIRTQQVQKVLEALKAQRAMQAGQAGQAGQSVPQYPPLNNRADMDPNAGAGAMGGPQGGY